MNDAIIYDAMLDAGREPATSCPVCTGDEGAMLDAGREPATSCPVCTGDEGAMPCSEACEEIVILVRRERRVRNIYRAAWRALAMARVYHDEDKGPSKRLTACLDQVRAYRDSVRFMRSVAA